MKPLTILFPLVLLGCSNAVEEASKATQDTASPQITQTRPENATTDFNPGGTIAVVFSEPMEASSVVSSFTLSLQDSEGALSTVPGSVSYKNDTRTAIYVFKNTLSLGQTYVANVDTSATDTSGNRLLEPRQWTFKTTPLGEGAWKGIKQLGVDGAVTYGWGVAVDAKGKVMVAGDTNGDLDGNTLAGTQDAFVTRYDAGGTRLWTKLLGVNGAYTSGQGVAVDADGNAVMVVGYTDGALPGNTKAGTWDAFIAKYSAGNILQWAKQLGVSGARTSGWGVAVDARGNVMVVGYTDGALPGNTLAGIQDAFIAKYSASGNPQWIKQLGVDGAWTYGQGVAVDASGNVMVAGQTDGDLDGNTLTGIWDAFVAKYNGADGELQWTQQLGVSGAYTDGWGVAVDASGNVMVAGYTNGDLDGNTLAGTRDAFIAKYSADGEWQWIKQLGGVDGAVTYGRGVAVDADGNVMVAGYTTGDLPENTLAGSRDAFIAKYNTGGDLQWTKQLGVDGAATSGRGVAVDADDNVMVAGYTSGDLDGNTLAGSLDAFVTRYDVNGTRQ